MEWFETVYRIIGILAVIYLWNFIMTMVRLEDGKYKKKKEVMVDIALPFFSFFKKHYTVIFEKYAKLK